MYFENEIISARQLGRLIVIEFLGITLLSSTGILTGKCGREGIVALVVSAIFTLILVWIALSICEKIKGTVFDVMEKYLGRGASQTIEWIFFVKYILSLAGVLLLMGTLVQRTLLQQYSIITIILPTVLLAVYGYRMGMEQRGRFAEVAFYFIVIPAIILIIFAWGKCDRYNIVPFFMGRWKKIFCAALWYSLISSPVEMLLFSGNHLKISERMKMTVCKSVCLVAVLNVIYYILNVGIFGIKNASEHNVSSIGIMQSSGHLESIMSLFMIVSLYALVNCYGHYAILMLENIFKRQGRDEKCHDYGTNSTGCYDKKRSMAYVLFTGIGACVMACVAASYGILVESGGENVAHVSLEKRDYVMLIGIDYQSEKFEIVYGFDSDSDKDNMYWEGENLLAAKDEYTYISPKNPDFSHIEVIVVGREVIEDAKALKSLRKFLEWDETIADNTLIVCAKNKAADIDVSGEDIKSMFDNNLVSYECEAYEMVSAMSDKNMTVVMPVIDLQDGNLMCSGVVISNGRGTCKMIDTNEANYLFLAQKNIEGRVINTGNGRIYNVINNRADIDIRVINNETIGVNIRLSGVLKNLSAYRIHQDETNEKIETELTDILSEMMLNDRLDYLRVYDRLAIADRGMWVKYADDRTEMYKHVYFYVKSEFEIK